MREDWEARDRAALLARIGKLEATVTRLEQTLFVLTRESNCKGTKDYATWHTLHDRHTFKKGDRVKGLHGSKGIVDQDQDEHGLSFYVLVCAELIDAKGYKFLGNPIQWYAKHCSLLEEGEEK